MGSDRDGDDLESWQPERLAKAKKGGRRGSRHCIIGG